MDYSYTTKEICDIFGVGRETLRHYEKLRLLRPQINEENGYREYGYWDVAMMVDVMKYRCNEFTLKETEAAMRDTDFEQIVMRIDEQKDYYRNQIQRYQMLEKKLAVDCNYLKMCEDVKWGELFEIRGNNLYFIPYRRMLELERYDILQKIFQNSQFFSTAWIFNENQEIEDPRQCLGFVTELEFAAYLEMEGGFVLNSAPGVGMMLDVTGMKMVGPSDFDEFQAMAKAKYDNLDTECFGILCSRFKDHDNVLQQYVFAFKKYKKEA